jgi:hypothetical protein
MSKEQREEAYREESDHYAVLRAQEELRGFEVSKIRMRRTLTEELIEEISQSVAAGNFNRLAIGRCGLDEVQFYSWMKKGKKDNDRFQSGKVDKLTLEAQLMLVLGVAEGALHTALLEDVLGCDDPKLKLEFMKLRWPRLYSKNPNAHTINDETGEEEKITGLDVLTRMIGEYLENNSPDKKEGGSE